jgi:hypothetical protein
MNIEENKIKHPFKVPESYFEDLEEIIMSKTKIDVIKTHGEFKTPIDFFNQLESSILEKTVAVNKPKMVVNKSYKVYFRSAAAVFLFGSLGTAIYYKSINKDEFEHISSDEMVKYLADQSINYSEIVPTLNENEIKNIKINQATEQITDDELLLYATENEI